MTTTASVLEDKPTNKMISSFRVLPKLVVLVCTVSSLAYAGCSHQPVQPIRTGLVRSGFQTSAATIEASQRSNIVVWSNHPEVEQPLLEWLEQLQGPVGNDGLVRRAFMEQRGTLPSIPQDMEILQLARRVGAGVVVIAEIITKPVRSIRWPPHRHDDEAGNLIYVAARAFAIDTHTMQWSGTAECTQPLLEADKLALPLARLAVATGMGRSADDPLLQQAHRICTGGVSRATE